MQIKFYAASIDEEKIQEFPDDTSLKEVYDHYHEWLAQVADAGFEILEPNPGEPVPLALKEQEEESYFDDDIPSHIQGTRETEDSLKDYMGEIAW